MSYNCGDCGTKDFACIGWDGIGSHLGEKYPETTINYSIKQGSQHPRHNLIPECPKVMTSCQYRLKKTPSAEIKVAIN